MRKLMHAILPMWIDPPAKPRVPTDLERLETLIAEQEHLAHKALLEMHHASARVVYIDTYLNRLIETRDSLQHFGKGVLNGSH